MFIFWGEYDTEKKRGVVADKCGCCGKVTLLRMTERFRVSHFYFIPLGSGKSLGSVLKCSECNGKTTGDGGAYARFLTEKQTKTLSVGEVLQETNPRLARAIATRAKLEKEAREAQKVAPGMPDPRVKLAFAKLAEMNVRDPEVIDLQARLAQWAALDSQAQAKLLGDVDGLEGQRQQAENALQFIRSMGQSFKTQVDPGLAFLAFLLMAGLGIAFFAGLFEGQVAGYGSLGSVVMAFILAVVLQKRRRRTVHKRFFQNTFLPEAESRGIVVAHAIAILRNVNGADESIHKGVRGPAQNMHLLKEVREEAGQSD